MSYVVLCINICIIYSWNCLSSWCIWAANSIHCSSISIHFSCSDIIIWSLLFWTVIIFSNSSLILWPHLFLTFASLTCSHSQMFMSNSQKAVSYYQLAATHSQMDVSHRSLCSLVYCCLKSGLGQDCKLLVLWSDQTCPEFRHQVQYVKTFYYSGGSVECLGPSILSRAFPI